jgi:Fe-S cluster biogenesis protein NfuA
LVVGRAAARPWTSPIEERALVLAEKVKITIEAIRPAIQADGGDIFLRGVDEETGLVSVELVGACVSCPASTTTLKAGIERILKDRVEGVTEVVNVGETLLDGTPVSL